MSVSLQEIINCKQNVDEPTAGQDTAECNRFLIYLVH